MPAAITEDMRRRSGNTLTRFADRAFIELAAIGFEAHEDGIVLAGADLRGAAGDMLDGRFGLVVIFPVAFLAMLDRGNFIDIEGQGATLSAGEAGSLSNHGTRLNPFQRL